MLSVKVETEKIVKKIIEDHCAYLIDFSITDRGRQRFLRAVVQSLKGITLDEIADITRSINNDEALDRLFPEGYQLEVSSPGIDQKLKDYRDFPRNLGRAMKIYHHSTAMKSPLTGTLVEISESQLVFEINGVQKRFSFDELDYAKVLVKW